MIHYSIIWYLIWLLLWFFFIDLFAQHKGHFQLAPSTHFFSTNNSFTKDFDTHICFQWDHHELHSGLFCSLLDPFPVTLCEKISQNLFRTMILLPKFPAFAYERQRVIKVKVLNHLFCWDKQELIILRKKEGTNKKQDIQISRSEK